MGGGEYLGTFWQPVWEQVGDCQALPGQGVLQGGNVLLPCLPWSPQMPTTSHRLCVLVPHVAHLLQGPCCPWHWASVRAVGGLDPEQHGGRGVAKLAGAQLHSAVLVDGAGDGGAATGA